MAGVFYFYLSMEDVEPMPLGRKNFRRSCGCSTDETAVPRTDTWNVLLEKGLLTQADKDTAQGSNSRAR